jgi:hypothetical protein
VRNSASLLSISNKERFKTLFLFRFSPEIIADDVEKTLKEKLSLQELVCARHKTKFNTFASFHVSVIEDEFPLISNTGVWPAGCLIVPFYGKLTPDHVNSSTPVTGDTDLPSSCNRKRGGSPHPSQ